MGFQMWWSIWVFQEIHNKCANTCITLLEETFWRHIDASSTAIGGTLTQLDDIGKDRVVAFFSMKLSPVEQNYTTNDLEVLRLI